METRNEHFIGLDVGTSTVCGCLFDASAEEPVKTVVQSKDDTFTSGNPCFRFQDPDNIVAQAIGVIRELASGCRVAGIGISCQMHGIVYIDGHGNALSPLITWQDGRGDLSYRDGLTYAEHLSKASGEHVYTGEGAVTLFHDTVNGLIPQGTARIATIGDLLAMRLCGTDKPATSPGIARSIGLFDIRSGSFKTALIESLGMDPGLFPDISRGARSAVGQCGLLPDSPPVFCAIGDNQASVLGAYFSCRKSISRGARPVVLNVGTGSQISFVSALPDNIDSSGSVEVRPFADDTCLLVGAPACGGSAYAALADFFSRTAGYFSASRPEDVYPAMEKLLGESLSLEPGEYPSVRTWFSGSRSRKGVYGSFTDVTLANFTPSGLIRGVAEGIIADLLDCFHEINSAFRPAKPPFIIATGGALRRNETFSGMVSERFGLPVQFSAYKEEAALGAAVHSAGYRV